MCKRWRDVARLAWSTRQCLRIKHKNTKLTSYDDLTQRRTYFTSSSKHVLTNLIAAKHIGRALTRLEFSGSYLMHSDSDSSDTSSDASMDDDDDDDDYGLSLTALAQQCPNLEYLDLRRVSTTNINT